MNRKIVVLVVMAMAMVGIAYSSMLNSQPAQPSTPSNNCKLEALAGNFTSSPEMSDTSSGPYNVTFYIQNLGSQSANITKYTDNYGLTQSVNWMVHANATESFHTMLYRTENSLALETSCSTLFGANLYYPSTGSVHHYEVNLFVSLGGAMT